MNNNVAIVMIKKNDVKRRKTISKIKIELHGWGREKCKQVSCVELNDKKNFFLIQRFR